MKLMAGWLRDINPEWEIVSGNAIFSERSTKSNPDDTHLTPSQKYGVLPQSDYMEKTGSAVVLNLVGGDNMKHVEENDFIIHLRSFQGGIEHSSYSGKVSNAYCVLIPSARIEPRFYRWVLKSNGFIQELSTTTDQLRDGQSIKFEQFRQIGFPLPPIEAQRQIADYLDEQITLIDRVIQSKRDVLALYIEEFNSYRNQLVTGVAIQPKIETNLDWISIAPERWTKLPLRALFKWQKGKDPARLDALYCAANPGEFPVYSGQTSNEGVFGMIDTFDFSFTENCALVSTVGAQAGSMRVVSGKFSLSQNCALITPTDSRSDTLFLYYLWPSIWSSMKSKIPSDMQPSLRFSDLSDTWLFLPSKNEQAEIVKLLGAREYHLEKLNSIIYESIDKLEEYKESLITSAVTGKINLSTGRSVA